MTDNFSKFKEYRNLYPNFIYKSFEKIYSDDELKIIYHFEIEGLKEFNPSITFNKDIIRKNIDEEFISMHVTPKNIDESMKRISYTISEGINHLLHN